MNFVILAVGSYGDVLPLVGMAKQLLHRGHTVTFLTNEHFGELVRKAGVGFIPIGTAREYDAMVDNPALWNPHTGWRLIMKRLVSGALEEAYLSLASTVTRTKTVMISSTLGVAARLVQETHHIPHATVHLSPGVFHSAYRAPRIPGLALPDWLPVRMKHQVWKILDHLIIDPVMKPRLNRFRRKIGLPPVSRIFHDWLHSPDLVLALFPDWFAPPQPDWPHVYHRISPFRQCPSQLVAIGGATFSRTRLPAAGVHPRLRDETWTPIFCRSGQDLPIIRASRNFSYPVS